MLSFDEKFFKEIDKFFTKLFYEAKSSSVFINRKTAYLSNYTIRFSNFASFFSKKNISVIESDSFFGIIGNKFFLPKSIDVSSYFEINILVYFYKIIFYLINDDFCFYSTVNFSLKKLFLFNLLVVSCIHKHLSFFYKKFTNCIVKYLYFYLYNNINLNLPFHSGNSLFFELCIKQLFFFSLRLPYVACFTNKNFDNLFLLVKQTCDFYTTTQYTLLRHLNILYKRLNEIYPIDSNFIYKQNILWNIMFFYYPIFDSVKLFGVINTIKLTQQAIVKTIIEKKISPMFTKKVNEEKKRLGVLPIASLFHGTKTLETYDGSTKEYDTKDELSAHSDALQEVNFNNVVRNEYNVQSIFRLSTIILSNFVNFFYKNINIKNYTTFFYDEWDFYHKKYRKNWCRVCVYPSSIGFTKNISETANILKNFNSTLSYLKIRVCSIFNQDIWKKRQLDGSEIDFDSVVNNFSSFLLKKHNDNRLYLFKKMAIQMSMFYIILDSSLSTDTAFELSKVINYIHIISLLLGETLESIGSPFSLAYFYSNTHTLCNFTKLKKFTDKWIDVKDKIINILPQGYTRVGPALRHALFELSKFEKKNKIIILISDSKPTDYDFYEGIYGVEDIRQVVYEANTKNIKLKSLSIIDDFSTTYLVKMYGKNNFYYIRNKHALKEQLLKLLLSCFKK